MTVKQTQQILHNGSKQKQSSKRTRLHMGASGLVLAAYLASAPAAVAQPQGGSVVAGSAAISAGGQTLTVTQNSSRTILDWDSFSIGADETTRFVQPDTTSVAANRVTGVDPSSIMGNLEANGQVILVNPNGVVFGAGSKIDTAGLIATVHDFDNADFMAGGGVRFNNGSNDQASVVNEGTITIHDAGMAALVAPHVRNSGVIRADLGKVELAAAKGFSVDLYGDGLLSFAPGDALDASFGDGSQALIETAGSTSGEQVYLTAHAALSVVNSSINVTGVVRARSFSQVGGTIHLNAPGRVNVATSATLNVSGSLRGSIDVDAGTFLTDGQILAEGVNTTGGEIFITAEAVGLGGRVSASGSNGGVISVTAENILSLAETVNATGSLGAGGSVTYQASRITEMSTSTTNVSGFTDGGTIMVDGGRHLASSGTYAASGQWGHGGRIDMTAGDVRLLSSTVLANGGLHGGGVVRVGGAFQGGKAPDVTQSYHDSFVGRWGALPSLRNASQTFINDGTTISVAAAQGAGGTAVVWSDDQTTFLGSINATGTTVGGSVEISSAANLRKAQIDNVITGAGGHLLLDPKNLIVGETPGVLSDWAYQGLLGSISASSNDDVNVALEESDNFGGSVALSDDALLLAVGAPGDDGIANANTDAGAVYLLSFSGSGFAGGQIQGIIGSGYTGGKNVDVSLDAGDRFGAGVSLNSTGTRLAIGAPYDDARDGGELNSGAVHLFSFSDISFSGGVREAIVGSGYGGLGAKNIDSAVDSNQTEPLFGASVSLNADATRLAVGAPQFDGLVFPGAQSDTDVGGVFLFSFSDTNFSGGVDSLKISRITQPPSARELGITLDNGDKFGTSVTLNGVGDRLAVGAIGDDGFSDTASNSGAVRLYSFSDTNYTRFNITAGPVIGTGYVAGNDINTGHVGGDNFGSAVSFNADGTRLAIGGPNGAPNGGGYVSLYTFNNSAFGGGTLASFILKNASGPNDYNLATDAGDLFGAAVSLNGDGTRLVAGAPAGDGSANSLSNSGEIYGFTFSDTSFTSPTLASTAGQNYSGAANANVPLEVDDKFGARVTLNADGTLMAVGADGDDGFNNVAPDSGAVYLYSFSGAGFSGGALEGIIGRDYTGGKNINLQLEAADYFGLGEPSFNAAGDRLAAGADGDDGFNNAGPSGSGALYLFTFSDTNFSNGSHVGTIGSGYVGANDVNIAAELNTENFFGDSAALNAAGDRLVVGAGQGDGAGGMFADSGDVFLFSFTDTNFGGGSLEGMIGRGYTGGKNFDFSTLPLGSNFGNSVSLTADGKSLAIGAVANNADKNGIVYLFTFSDAAFSGASHVGSIGMGLSGGLNVSANVEQGDFFGRSVSLSGDGLILAVGAPKADGSGNGQLDSGEVHFFSFTDGSFSGGAAEGIIGYGYTGPNDINASFLSAGESFGTGAALNGDGTRLVAAAPTYGGQLGAPTDSGAIFFFTRTPTAPTQTPSGQTYTSSPISDITVNASDIVTLLEAGTAVTLQASNDLTVNNAITVTGTPVSVGALTLQAGRSVFINANITTVSGDVSLIANDLLANGVVDAQRDAGAAVITMAAGTAIDAGSGTINFDLRAGTGKTNLTSGNITLGDLTAASINVTNQGPTAGSGIVVAADGFLTATGTGDALVLAGDTFTNNNTSATALNASNSAGRFLVWSGTPVDDTRGALGIGFKQYSATFGGTTVAQATGDGFLYELAPTASLSLTGTVSQVYDGTTAVTTLAAGNYGAISGAVDGDVLVVSTPLTNGTFDTKNVGTGKTVTATGTTVSNAGGTIYGYQVGPVTGDIGTVTAAPLTLSGSSADNKVYDAGLATTFNYGTLSAAFSGDTVSLTSAAGGGAFADKNVGNNKAVSATTPITLTGSDAANYVVTAPTGITANITHAALNVTGVTADTRVYNTTTAATLANGSITALGSDVVNLVATGAVGVFSDKNVGTGKTVTASGYAISGTDATNYTLVQPTGVTGTITAAPLALTSVSATDRVYDAGTVAAVTGGSITALAGDSVTLDASGATGAFADKNVGASKAVTVSGYTLSGTDALNYSLTHPTGVTATITAASLTLTGTTAANRAYDTTTAATVTYGTLSTALASDVVSLTSATGAGAFDNKNAGTSKAVTVTAPLGLTGTDAGNYVVTAPTGLTANITAASLAITGVTAANKVYDGTRAATLSGGSVTPLGNDTIVLDTASAVGTFATKDAGTGWSVAATGYSISGTDAANYSLVNPTGLAADITKADLVVTGAAAANKVYDATTAAAVSGGLITPFGSDTVTLTTTSFAGVFADKNVGTGKAVTVTGYSISGTDSTNYNVIQPTGLTANITTADLAVTGVTAATKVYDANTVAALSGESIAALSGDTVTLSAASVIGAFADKNVGTDKAVTASGYTISGTDAANYTLVQPTSVTGTITAATLAVTGVTADNKVYDTNTVASLSGAAAIAALTGDTVVLSGTGVGAFADKNVGTGKAVTVSGYSISGADAGNYTLVQPAGLTANITAANLTVTGAIAANKVYDINTVAAVSGGSIAALSGDTVTLSAASVTGAFADKNVGTGKSVTAFGYMIFGTDAGNYTLVQPTGLTADITPASLAVTSVTAGDKVYDTNTVAALSGGMIAPLGGDNVSLSAASAAGTFADKNVGIGKAVTASGYTISGPDAGNYTLVQPTGLTARITTANLIITGVTANKVYDANTVAPLSGGSITALSGDTVTLSAASAVGAFADKNVGTGKAVTASGYTISGPDAGNYYLFQPTGLTADITPASLAVTGVTADNKIYDANTVTAVSGGSITALSGDTVTLSAASAAGTFADKNVGTGKAVTASGYTISGADAGNYTLVQPTGLTADVTAANLAVTGVTAANKVYDATTVAALSGGSIAALSGDTVTLSAASAAGTFADKNVGPGKAVAASGYSISGTDAANYTLVQPTGLTASITARQLTVTGGTAANKVYDTTTAATVTTDALVGVLTGDIVNLTATGVFADKNVGTGKAVTATYALDNANYALASTNGGLTANITKADLSVTGATVANKVYDTNTVAAVSGGSIAALSGDTVTLSAASAAGAFADKNVGTGKAVTASGYSISGTDADNYTLVQPTGLTANITAAALTLTGASAVGKVYDGTDTAVVTYGTLSGVLAGDIVSLANAGGAGKFSDQNVGTGKLVSVLSTAALTGTDASNYTFAQLAGLTADITARQLTVTGAAAANKVYDATTAATITTDVLAGVLSGDTVNLNVTGAFADKNVGLGKAVIGTYGIDNTNYALASTSGSLTADITVRTLVVTNVTAANKVYDATTVALLSGGTVSALSGDGVTLVTSSASGTFNDKNVGDAKSVTAVGYTLSGVDADNYAIAQPIGVTADISKLAEVDWIGGADGNWSDPNNWSPAIVPDGSNVSIVTIPSGSTVIYDGQGPATVDSITGGGNLIIRGDGLSVSGDVELDGVDVEVGTFNGPVPNPAGRATDQDLNSFIFVPESLSQDDQLDEFNSDLGAETPETQARFASDEEAASSITTASVGTKGDDTPSAVSVLKNQLISCVSNVPWCKNLVKTVK